MPTVPLPDEFAGRRGLAIGGSRGIGAAIAQRLIDGGAALVTTGRSPREDTPKTSTFIPSDLRPASGAAELVDQAVQTLGGLDIVVNNAGASRVYLGGPASIPDAEWRDSLDVNFLAAVRVVSAALPALKESGVGGGDRHRQQWRSQSPPAITAP
jgi:NAD(P)-dependent dehydrogenase (short-subunit alcohol dehydrogenase family)